MIRQIAALGLAASLLVFTSCVTARVADGEADDSSAQASDHTATGLEFRTGSRYFLLTNLHADPAQPVLYSTNYLKSTLLPIGSEVILEGYNRKKFTFTYILTGVKYTYTRDKHLQESFDSNLRRYFGAHSNAGEVSSMSMLDQEGIRDGVARIGMTKAGVVLAIGYPPDHATSTLELGAWKYWKNRWVARLIRFDAAGIVSSIEG